MKKMSDPNSAMMQMVMQMMKGQNQQTSNNVIKAQNSLQQQNQQMQNGRDFVKVMPAEFNGMKGFFGFGYIDDSEIMKDSAFQNEGFKSANLDVVAKSNTQNQQTEQRQNIIAPNPQQQQMAKNLAQQFAASKKQPFTPEQMQVIESKILERIMQTMK